MRFTEKDYKKLCSRSHYLDQKARQKGKHPEAVPKLGVVYGLHMFHIVDHYKHLMWSGKLCIQDLAPYAKGVARRWWVKTYCDGCY